MNVQIPEVFVEQGAVVVIDGVPMFNPDYAFILLRGGRGRGGSWTMVTIALIMAMCEPMEVLILRNTSAKIKDSVWKLIYGTARRLGVEQHIKQTNTYIQVSNGSRFTYDYMHGNETGIRSKEGVRLTLGEECQDWESEPIKAMIPTVMRDDNSQFVGCFNQQDEDDPIETIIMADEDCLTVNSTIEQNPFAPKRLLRQYEKMRKYDPESANHIYGLEYNTKSNEVIFSDKYVIEDIPVSKREGTTLYYGIDVGFATDPCTFIITSIDGDDILVHEAFFMYQKDPDAVRDFLLDYESEHPINNHIYVDSADSALGSILKKTRLKDRVKSKWGKDKIEDSIRWLRSHRRIVINSHCKEMIEEAKKYKYKVDKKAGVILPVPKDDFNHGWDAVRYSLHRLIRRGIL